MSCASFDQFSSLSIQGEREIKGRKTKEGIQSTNSLIHINHLISASIAMEFKRNLFIFSSLSDRVTSSSTFLFPAIYLYSTLYQIFIIEFRFYATVKV